jgi:predicted dehydrogenase
MTAAVVIVGGGKAGALHYRAYRQMARAGVLPLDGVVLVDPHGEPAPELAGLVREAGAQLDTFETRAALMTSPRQPDLATAIVDLCAPASVLVNALRDYYASGFRRFLVEKPFLVTAEDEADVRHILSTSQVVLVRNYLFSGVHRVVRTMLQTYDLQPLVCITNFSKDRRADSARGRGAASGAQAPTVFEIEMPHQLYIGADLTGAPAVLEHAEATDMVTTAGIVAHQGRGVIVGRSDRDCVFVHYSDLEHPTVVRTLDLICQGGLSIQATYSPICEELRDVSAGVVLTKGDAVLQKRLFTEDNNMLATVADAYATLTGSSPGRTGIEDAMRQSEVIRLAIAGQAAAVDKARSSRADLMQDLVARSFTLGLDGTAPTEMLHLLNERRRQRFASLLPTMDPFGGAASAAAPRAR